MERNFGDGRMPPFELGRGWAVATLILLVLLIIIVWGADWEHDEWGGGRRKNQAQNTIAPPHMVSRVSGAADGAGALAATSRTETTAPHG